MDPKCLLTSIDLQTRRARCQHQPSFLFFQSWKYTRSIKRRLRQHFVFHPEIRQFVDDFMAASRPPGWLANFVRVGVHVRRGDTLTDEKINFGYTTPGARYFAHAMRYFVDRFDRVQFIAFNGAATICPRPLQVVTYTVSKKPLCHRAVPTIT